MVAHWRVSLEGKNFWLKLDDSAKKFGFFTTRYVEADDPENAENAAVQMLREDPKLQAVLNDRSDPPTIFAGEIIEIVPDPECVNAGYSFYLDDTESN